ncbi:MAG: hypothetical protein QOD09_3093 [Bradyrhizobium sp.]|jgi:hypothetical protein|nr:hypothetical protein [Bradyrhizobium sp.]
MWGIEVKDVLIVFIGLPFAVLISWYFFRRGLGRKQLAYALKVEDLLFKGEQYPAQLKITYRDQAIDVLTKAEIYLWNAGNQPITGADLNTEDKLRIVWPDEFELLDYTVRYQTRPTNKLAVGNDSKISFEYLNVGDGAIVDVVGTRNSKDRVRIPDEYAEIKGEVVGAEEQPKRQDFDFSVKRNYAALILFGLGLSIMGFWTFFSDRARYLADFKWWYYPVGGVLALFLIMMLSLGIFGVVAWWSGYRVPVNMIVLGQRTMTWGERFRLYFS